MYIFGNNIWFPVLWNIINTVLHCTEIQRCNGLTSKRDLYSGQVKIIWSEGRLDSPHFALSDRPHFFMDVLKKDGTEHLMYRLVRVVGLESAWRHCFCCSIMQDKPAIFLRFQPVAASCRRPAGAIPDRTGGGVGFRQPIITLRVLVMAASTFWHVGFYTRLRHKYSAAEKTRVNVEICSVLAKVPRGYTSEASDEWDPWCHLCPHFFYVFFWRTVSYSYICQSILGLTGTPALFNRHYRSLFVSLLF